MIKHFIKVFPPLTSSPNDAPPSPTCSPDVRQHLWKCVGHHPEAVLRNGSVPHPNVKSQGVHPLPSDPQPS